MRTISNRPSQGPFYQACGPDVPGPTLCLEKRYNDAIALGQTLQDAFPENGHYALLTGRSQCALLQYALCAETLEALSRRHHASETSLGPQDERFEMYYYLGIARNETGQYDLAFEALRQAINEDPAMNMTRVSGPSII